MTKLDEVRRALFLYSSAWNPQQKRWMEKNVHYMIESTKIIADYDKSSWFSPWLLSEQKAGGSAHAITLNERENGEDRDPAHMAETLFHEYGHLIFKEMKLGGWRSIFISEIKAFVNKIAITNSKKSIYRGLYNYMEGYNAMIVDAIGMVFQIDLPGAHERGYHVSKLETECFAEYLAYAMTRGMECEEIRLFERECPRTAKILKKKVNSLWKNL